MSRKDIEARLDRALADQIQVPRLDRRFDAAVWARIEAAEATVQATNPGRVARTLRASRWLVISNYIGVAVALGVALYFLMRTHGGVELPISDVSVPVPVMIPEQTVNEVVGALGQVLGIAALAFGLSFTSLGRRVRASFS